MKEDKLKLKPIVLRRKGGGYDMILDYVLDSDGEVIGAGESHDISRHVDKMLKEVFDAQQICGPSAEIVKTFAKRHFPFLSGKCRKDKLGYLWISKRMFWEE